MDLTVSQRHHYGGDLPLTPLTPEPMCLSPSMPVDELYYTNLAFSPHDLQQQLTISTSFENDAPQGRRTSQRSGTTGPGTAQDWQANPVSNRAPYPQIAPHPVCSPEAPPVAGRKLGDQSRSDTLGSSEQDDLSETHSPNSNVHERRKETRRAQNRAAQRAFRARKEDTIKEVSCRLAKVQQELCHSQLSNVNLQSQNETLQSTNEELQSTNSDLQSSSAKLEEMVGVLQSEVHKLDAFNKTPQARAKTLGKLLPGAAHTADASSIVAPQPTRITRPSLSMMQPSPRQVGATSVPSPATVRARTQTSFGRMQGILGDDEDLLNFREAVECGAFPNFDLAGGLTGWVGWQGKGFDGPFRHGLGAGGGGGGGSIGTSCQDGSFDDGASSTSLPDFF